MKPTFYTLRRDGDPESGLLPSPVFPAAVFTSEDHTESIHCFYENDDASVRSGVWECAPCVVPVESYPVNEMMTILSGKVMLTDVDGNSTIYYAGDSFFVAQGTSCIFTVTEKVKKFFMTAT